MANTFFYFACLIRVRDKFTFILPAYKSDYLESALRSIPIQSDVFFNVIVSDDCSPSDISGIVNAFNDKRVSYRRNETNIGAACLVDHWNLLLSKVETDYVIVASDDDIYSPFFLEEIDELVRRHPQADLLMARANIIDNSGKAISDGDAVGPEFMNYQQFIDSLLDLTKVHCVGNYVFKTSALKSLGGFVKFPLAWKSDTATVISLAEHGVPCTSDTLFSFRRSGDSITTTPKGTMAYDKLKLQATGLFFRFIEEIKTKIGERDYSFFKRRLCGEMQSYYWTLDFRAFLELYVKMISHNRFASFRNSVSFLYNWFVERRSFCGSEGK